MTKISSPFSNYFNLILEKRKPYYDLIKYIVDDMEKMYVRLEYGETIYAINPKRLREEIEQVIPYSELSVRNICRTILAALYGSNLRKDEEYYVTITRGGRRNYHIKVNSSVISKLRSGLGIS